MPLAMVKLLDDELEKVVDNAKAAVAAAKAAAGGKQQKAGAGVKRKKATPGGS